MQCICRCCFQNTITVELFTELDQSYNWFVFWLWLSIRIILAKSNKNRRVSTWEIQYMMEGLNLTIEGPFLTCFMFLEWSRTTCWSSSYIARLHYEIFMFEFPFFCSLLLQCYCSNMHKTNFNTFHCLLFEANWCSQARTYLV